MSIVQIQPPLKVPKAWGQETVITNNEKYCGKILTFNPNSTFSMHYHMLKDETWYVVSGEFSLHWIDTDVAKSYVNKLKIGDVIHIKRGQPHKLVTVTGGSIFEVSTEHYDDDSYRILPGDSQQ